VKQFQATSKQIEIGSGICSGEFKQVQGRGSNEAFQKHVKCLYTKLNMSFKSPTFTPNS